jgi:hypothetical protein
MNELDKMRPDLLASIQVLQVLSLFYRWEVRPNDQMSCFIHVAI